MALTTWKTTYGELLGRLTAIRNGIPDPDTGKHYDISLSKRRLPASALLAIRRFTRVCDAHVSDFQAEMQALSTEGMERGLQPGDPLPDDLAERQQALLNAEVLVEVSTIPLEVLVEDGDLTLQDLEILAPIIEDE